MEFACTPRVCQEKGYMEIFHILFDNGENMHYESWVLRNGVAQKYEETSTGRI